MIYLILTVLIPIPLGIIAVIYDIHQKRWFDRYRYLEHKLMDLRMELDRIEQDVDDPKGIPREEPETDEWEMDSILCIDPSIEKTTKSPFSSHLQST